MSHARNPSTHSQYGAGAGAGAGGREKTYFEQQREALVMDIATSFEHVLANINKLNRGLEATIAVGNEFSSVEALWSQFESVMAQQKEQQQEQEQEKGGQRSESQQEVADRSSYEQEDTSIDEGETHA